jgi:flagellar biogenesis protein FliO
MKAEAQCKITRIDDASPAAARGLRHWLHLCWRRFCRLAQRAPRRLRLCETLALGERRFVAVIAFEKERYLVGGTPASLALLARLGGEENNANPADASATRWPAIPVAHKTTAGAADRTDADTADADNDADHREAR